MSKYCQDIARKCHPLIAPPGTEPCLVHKNDDAAPHPNPHHHQAKKHNGDSQLAVLRLPHGIQLALHALCLTW